MREKKSPNLRIKWLRSGIGFPRAQKNVVKSLGLRKLNHVVEREDTPQIRGLVAKTPHLVTIVEDRPKPRRVSVAEYTIVKRGVSSVENTSPPEASNPAE